MISLLELMLWQGNHFGVGESDYSLTLSEQLFRYINDKLHSMKRCPLCTSPTRLGVFLLC